MRALGFSNGTSGLTCLVPGGHLLLSFAACVHRSRYERQWREVERGVEKVRDARSTYTVGGRINVQAYSPAHFSSVEGGCSLSFCPHMIASFVCMCVCDRYVRSERLFSNTRV